MSLSCPAGASTSYPSENGTATLSSFLSNCYGYPQSSNSVALRLGIRFPVDFLGQFTQQIFPPIVFA